MTTSIAHLSDLHFGSEAPGAADELGETLRGLHLDLVLISGDLTMAARNREFMAARRFVDTMNAPVLMVPGNHDISPYKLVERFVQPYRRWRRHLTTAIEPSWCNDDVAVIGLNTARRMRFKLDWSLGSVSRAQIRALRHRFKAMSAQPFRIVAAHHPFLMDGETEGVHAGPRQLVNRASRALAVLAAERVDVVASGHLHRTYTAQYAVKGPAAHTLHVIQAGTALSARTRGEPNSFNLIRATDRRLTVHIVRRTTAGWTEDTSTLVDIQKPDAATAAS
ncbi:MAG: metallophosphoesterase [Pseudomonadota bacterium]